MANLAGHQKGGTMKVSLLIKGLQDMMADHGDLPVQLMLATPPEEPTRIVDDIYLGYDEYEDKDLPKQVISIRDFPY